jgi:hypothetical protein
MCYTLCSVSPSEMYLCVFAYHVTKVQMMFKWHSDQEIRNKLQYERNNSRKTSHVLIKDQTGYCYDQNHTCAHVKTGANSSERGTNRRLDRYLASPSTPPTTHTHTHAHHSFIDGGISHTMSYVAVQVPNHDNCSYCCDLQMFWLYLTRANVLIYKKKHSRN